MKKDPFGKEFDDQFKHPFFTDTDNYIRKYRIKHFVIICLLSAITCVIINWSSSRYDKHTEKAKSLLGKKVVLDKDTLLIINYSSLDKTYSLSNGAKCDMSLAETHTITEIKTK